MRLALLTLLMCVCADKVYAQQSMDSLCKDLAVYMPIDGVEFNPGATDVPADLNAVQDPVYGSISIPVEIDLAEYFDRPELEMMPGMNLKPDISNIEINQNGAVFYNGQEISQDIQRVCGSGEKQEKAEASDSPPIIKPAPKAKPVPKKKPAPIPVEMAKNSVKAAVKKEVVEVKPTRHKSSVSVFNGPKQIIADKPVIEELLNQQPKAVAPIKTAQEKATVKDQNAIDVEVLNAQDNTDETIDADRDDDSIIEGQYP